MIKLFLSDVDGTLTDGKRTIISGNRWSTVINTKDGLGFKLLKNMGVKVGVISGEEGWAYNNDYLQGHLTNTWKLDFAMFSCTDKLDWVDTYCTNNKIKMSEVAYIGDDINDASLLSRVGIKACPRDAVDSIVELNDLLVMQRKGGDGCVREFVDFLISGKFII